MTDTPDLLVTGSHGQLGHALLRLAGERATAAVGHDVDTLDITDAEVVQACLDELRPRAVINCAAHTGVDQCESEEDLATCVNGTAVGHLATACNLVGATLIQISTDYVFPGNATRPYREVDPLGPISAYGRSKLRGEEAARRAEHSLIVRTAWLYGHGGANFVEAIRRQIDSGATTLRVVADQIGCPTYCEDLARAILDLVAIDTRGVVHAVNSGTTTWHGFACEIARLLAADIAIEPVDTAAFPRPAPRPAYSVLDTSRLVSLLGEPMPAWQDALQRYMERPCES